MEMKLATCGIGSFMCAVKCIAFLLVIAYISVLNGKHNDTVDIMSNQHLQIIKIFCPSIPESINSRKYSDISSTLSDWNTLRYTRVLPRRAGELSCCEVLLVFF